MFHAPASDFMRLCEINLLSNFRQKKALLREKGFGWQHNRGEEQSEDCYSNSVLCVLQLCKVTM
jgi:hypothetical protein